MVHGYGAKNSASKHTSNLFKVLMGQEKKKNKLLRHMYAMRRRKDI
jgi:hypothetical protein